jgi:cytoskeletal protein CcmA (bactofilin family)
MSDEVRFRSSGEKGFGLWAGTEWKMLFERKPRTAPAQLSDAPAVQEGPTFLPTTPKVDTPMPESNLRTPSTPVSESKTVLGRSVVISGELSGAEDLLIEGQLQGTVRLQEHTLTVGQHGQVKAEINARQVVVLGAVQGNITARERIEIRKTGHVVGDLVSSGIAIEEGAYFKGSIDILREEERKAPAQTAPVVLSASS